MRSTVFFAVLLVGCGMVQKPPEPDRLVKKHIIYNTDQISAGSRSPDPDEAPIPRRAFIGGAGTS